jgi:signal transduction histidine kinase
MGGKTSSSITAEGTGARARASRGAQDPRVVSAYCWIVAVAYVGLMGSFAQDTNSVGGRRILELAGWLALTLASDGLRLRLWSDFTFAMSFPVALAAAMVFPPWQASLVAFAGSADFRTSVPWSRSLFNRAEVGVSVLCAGLVFREFSVSSFQWPAVVVAASAAATVDVVVNLLLVLLPVSVLHRSRPSEVFRRALGPDPKRAILVYCSLGLLAPVMALTYRAGGFLPLLALGGALVLAWMVHEQARGLHEAAKEVERKTRVIATATEQVARERAEERRLLAAELHDEVLPALFQVHLMGQVVRQDLEQGRLLELDEDVPQLLRATESAQTAIREVIGGLRRSSLGSDGLVATLRALAEELTSSSGVPFELELEDSKASPAAELVAYLVAREAMSNAARYARAKRILVRLYSADESLYLMVADDGIGFDPSGVDSEAHFGLELMRERAVSGGGSLVIDSRMGRGTTVSLRIPATHRDQRTH